MKRSRTAVAAAALLCLLSFSLTAQQSPIQATPQAKQQLTNALHEYREKKDGQGEAITLLKLGLTEAALGNVSGSRSTLTEAVEKMRAQNDFVGMWLGLTALSQIEAALGRPSEALPHIERALKVLSEAKTSKAPFSMKTLLAFGTPSGMTPEMMKMIEESNAAMKPILIQFTLEPMTHDLYGSILTQLGQFDKAETELKAAAAGAALAGGMYDFPIESHFGDLRFRQQRYDEARTHYVKALNAPSMAGGMLPMGGEQQLKATIYDRLVRLETITGHPEEAKRWSDKARELKKQPVTR